MADQNCTSPSSPAPVIVTSTTEPVKSDVDDSSSLSSSCNSTNFAEKNSSSDENTSLHSQPSQSNSKLLFSDSTVTSSSENRNGVVDKTEKSILGTSSSFLRPSILTSGISSFSTKNVDTTKANSSFDLKSPKLNFAASKFGDSSLINPLVSQPKNAFLNTVSCGNDKNESSSSSPPPPIPATQNNLLEINNVGTDIDDKYNASSLKMFSNIFNTNTSVSLAPKTTVISVPNFVFGQNLHERVTDSVKATNDKERPSTDIKINGTSDMLFTSVLKSTEIKEKFSSDVFGNSKESSSLIEDAARYQEARANKRKYEDVLVTTGEEDEQNILQINVKLFAFDNGAWVERGRGILRLNDKNCDGKTSSRIVIRTVGSLRVVLNTKVWGGMSLNRASERSARLTAMDPNGQVKIFLIQASLKDMSSLYPLLEDRIKLCKEKEKENRESPQKKIALEKKNV